MTPHRRTKPGWLRTEDQAERATPVFYGYPVDIDACRRHLFSGDPVSPDGVLAQGIITEPDPGNVCGWNDVEDVYTAMLGGNTYVNMHTQDPPAGEIRGQLVPGGSDHCLSG